MLNERSPSLRNNIFVLLPQFPPSFLFRSHSPFSLFFLLFIYGLWYHPSLGRTVDTQLPSQKISGRLAGGGEEEVKLSPVSQSANRFGAKATPYRVS